MLLGEHNSSGDVKLKIGADICNEVRKMVKEQLGFSMSGGIAHNKTLAKIACGLHKPDNQV